MKCYCTVTDKELDINNPKEVYYHVPWYYYLTYIFSEGTRYAGDPRCKCHRKPVVFRGTFSHGQCV